DAEVAVARLLLDEALRHEGGHAAAPVLGGQHVGGRADLGGLGPQVHGRRDVRLVDGARTRADLVPGEVAGEGAELALFVVELDPVGEVVGHGWTPDPGY